MRISDWSSDVCSSDLARRSSLIAYGGERESGIASTRYGDAGSSISAGDVSARQPTNLDALRRASVIGQAQARALPDRNFLITAGSFIPCVLQTAMDSSQPGYGRRSEERRVGEECVSTVRFRGGPV